MAKVKVKVKVNFCPHILSSAPPCWDCSVGRVAPLKMVDAYIILAASVQGISMKVAKVKVKGSSPPLMLLSAPPCWDCSLGRLAPLRVEEVVDMTWYW